MYRCPRPPVWARVHQALLEIARSDGAEEPPRPLILSGWAFSSASDKHRRWVETVEWAEVHGCVHITTEITQVDFVVWEHDEPAWDPRGAFGDGDE